MTKAELLNNAKRIQAAAQELLDKTSVLKTDIGNSLQAAKRHESKLISKERAAEAERREKEKAEAEFGDVMFSLINAARLYKINPDNALEQTNQKFINRFNYVEAHSIKEGKNLHDMTLEEMDKLWNEAKALEKESKQDDSSKGQV